jgi:guanine deaminase
LPGPSASRAIRGRLVWFEGDPALAGPSAVRDVEDGLVLVADGRIRRVGEAAALLPTLVAGTPVDDHRGRLVLPGLIDTHIHYPQTRVIASYGAQLLDWLRKYTFVEEQRFGDPAHAAAVARFFLDELLRQGTTTAVVYCTVHPESAEAFFAEAARRDMRMIAGKVMMDRNAPAALTDTPERGYRESKALLDRWHGQGRLGYVVTPRFAITSTEAQLEMAGTLLREHPGAWLQTHLSENRAEIETVARLFPWAKDYTDVYDRYGLLGERSLFGHCIHLAERELRRLAESRSVAAFCPTSNLFIGSGLFDLARLKDPCRPVRVSLATDVGGGTSYSMLETAAEAYKILQLQGLHWPALDAFYLMTLGNARALGLEERIGRLAPGQEADIVVLDPAATPAMAHRMESVEGDLAETLFVLMTMGDDRAVSRTYIAGEAALPADFSERT